jgi:tRNA1(Val) A37 N6-methylase TrmN6
MAIVCNELLGRELIKIYQDTESFNFSIDSLLLASFATITSNTKKICDLCTGNAPVPLYLSLRTNAKILGVEVQKASYKLASMSVLENNKQDQIELILGDLKGIYKTVKGFDLVTCNPPFFKVGSSKINPSDAKAIARHEILATLDDIVLEASRLCKSKGRFAMVHRPDRLVEILTTFKKYKIEPKRLQFIYPKAGSEANHILIEGIKDGCEGNLVVLDPLYVYGEDNKWTKEILKIYNYE